MTSLSGWSLVSSQFRTQRYLQQKTNPNSDVTNCIWSLIMLFRSPTTENTTTTTLENHLLLLSLCISLWNIRPKSMTSLIFDWTLSQLQPKVSSVVSDSLCVKYRHTETAPVHLLACLAFHRHTSTSTTLWTETKPTLYFLALSSLVLRNCFLFPLTVQNVWRVTDRTINKQAALVVNSPTATLVIPLTRRRLRLRWTTPCRLVCNKVLILLLTYHSNY